ncbi:ABC transporter ATP-binding protein [Cytobacillus firmus]|uniref:ABC transporter ATP-binding protein n=1 Tax=Cytobacillus firmus TaxID=1399 RepID=UPI0036874D0A
MLKIKNLHVNYGPINALKGISIDIKENHITAIIGANGSGKSTLLSTISGLIIPDQGEILYKDLPIQNKQVEERVKHGIAHVMEGRRLFKDQSVHDNLLLGFYFRNTKKNKQNMVQQINEVYERFPILGEKKNQKAGTLSGGQQQLLIISMAILSKPKLLLLDEPSLGLAPIIVDQVYQFLNELKDSGVTILVSEQMAALAMRIADYGYILERGKIVGNGDVQYLQSMMNSDEISSVYFG